MAKRGSKRRGQDDGDPRDEIVRLADLLNLTALTQDAVTRLLETAEHDAISYSAFAQALLRVEADARHERRLNRNLKRSRLGSVRDQLDDFDFTCRPKLHARVVRELLQGRWVEEARNKALARAACELGYRVRYMLTADVLDDLQAGLLDGSFRRVFARYQRIDVLALDEFGYEPFDTRATTHLFRLVSARHRLAPTLIAANTGFSKWKTLFPSEAQAVATVDRLVDNATILHFTGKSFRKPQHGSLDDPDEG